MTADDDPEARIRELERPLSDYGAPVELTAPSIGSQGHRSPRGNGRGYAVMFGVMAAVFVIAAAAALLLMSRGPTGTTPGHPTLPGGAAPAPSLPEPAPPVVASPAVPAPARGVTIIITGAGENKTLACEGNDVTVSGVSNTVVLTGQCAGLTVSGIGNIITVDEAASITASGLNNRVTYHAGKPEVGTSGLDNVVERG